MDIISVVRHLQLTVILKDKEDPTIDRNSLNIISVVGAFYTVIFKGIKEHKRERNNTDYNHRGSLQYVFSYAIEDD